MIAMVNMNLGNLGSVREAFRRVGAEVQIVQRPEDIVRAPAVIVPGVGAFGDGMRALRDQGLVEPLRDHARRGKPLLGICLGMQLLAEAGEEYGHHEGLGLLPGRVVKLRPADASARVPNMGWCDVRHHKPGGLFVNVPDGEAFYFAHSYHVQAADPRDVVATIQYGGQELVAAVQRGSLFGVQFHPEKSQDGGLNVLEAFARMVQAQEVAP